VGSGLSEADALDELWLSDVLGAMLVCDGCALGEDAGVLGLVNGFGVSLVRVGSGAGVSVHGGVMGIPAWTWAGGELAVGFGVAEGAVETGMLSDCIVSRVVITPTSSTKMPVRIRANHCPHGS
jgi:hypothetical protein